MNLLRKLARLVVISRPIVWLPTAGLYFGGALTSAEPAITWEVLWGLLFFAMPVGVVIYGLNDIADRESDAQNNRKGTVSGAVISTREIQFIVGAVLFLTVLFAAPLAITGHYWGAVGILVQLLLSYIYSVRPFHLKGRPVLDLVCVGTMVIAIFMNGFWMNAIGWHMPAWPTPHVLVVLALCAAAVHAIPEVLDYEVDKKMGDKTIAVVIGKRPTLIMCAVFFAICLLLVNSGIVVSYFLYATVATVLVAIINKRQAIFGLVLALIVPIPLMALYILLTR
jgi:4-hydroxybenzoate polyprenyltransferase